jgi:hypothetical protein
LGLFSRSWAARLAIDQVHFAILLALVPFAMLFTHNEEIRYYIIFVPVLCIWGTQGIALFSRWAQRTAEKINLHREYKGTIATAGRVLAVSAVLLPSAFVAIGQLNATRAERPFKEALINLAGGRPTPIKIASNAGFPAFEAHAGPDRTTLSRQSRCNACCTWGLVRFDALSDEMDGGRRSKSAPHS